MKNSKLFGRLSQGIDSLREYERITEFLEISRRSLANNAFDGVLTMVGVVMGQYLVGVKVPSSVVLTGVAAATSLSISGLWSAYLAESAERLRDLAELERISLTDLSQTKIGRAGRVAAVVVSLVNGLSPFIASLIVLMPFFFSSLAGGIAISYVASMALALVCLFGLGMFLGHISGRSLVGYGLRTAFAGVVAIVITRLLPTE